MPFSDTYYYTTLLMLVIHLTACTSSFDCSHSAGVSCQSLDQINRRIDVGELPLFAWQKVIQDRVLC